MSDLRPAHLPTAEEIAAFPRERLRVLFSGCLTGRACAYDGSTGGEYPHLGVLLAHPRVEVVGFCPEEFAFGTPRPLSDLHGGDGFAALDGRARLLTEAGDDWTASMRAAAEQMLRVARERGVHVAILLDISAACGSQVIYDGPRRASTKRYQRGPGIAAALLIRSGYKVLSQRDHLTLGKILAHLEPGTALDPTARDHHETEWFRTYFSV